MKLELTREQYTDIMLQALRVFHDCNSREHNYIRVDPEFMRIMGNLFDKLVRQQEELKKTK